MFTFINKNNYFDLQPDKNPLLLQVAIGNVSMRRFLLFQITVTFQVNCDKFQTKLSDTFLKTKLTTSPKTSRG